MSSLTDSKPIACAGQVMRRTDSHVIGNNKVAVTNSGDRHIAPPLRNFSLSTTPDSDERWGKDCIPEVVPPIVEPDDWVDLEAWDEDEEWLV